jgi:hypothetical protein
MFLEYLLLFMLYIYLLKIDTDRRNLLNITSENRDISVTSKTCTNIQSAENCKEFSETIRQISNYNNRDNSSFFKWFAGISKIKRFIEVRDYNNEPKNSIEFKIYSDFILDWIQYRNPLLHKVPFVSKIR